MLLITNIYRFMNDFRKYSSCGIYTISPPITCKITTFKFITIVIYKTKTRMIIYSKWKDIILKKIINYLLAINIPPIFSQDNERLTGKMILRKNLKNLALYVQKRMQLQAESQEALAKSVMKTLHIMIVFPRESKKL